MADEKPEETKKDDAHAPAPHKPRFNFAEAAIEYLINNLESAQSKLRAAGYDITGMSMLSGGLRASVKDAVRKHGGWTIPIVETAVSQGIKLLPMSTVLRGIVGPVVDLYFHGLRAVASEKDETKQRDALTVSQLFLDNAWSEIQKHKAPKLSFAALVKDKDFAAQRRAFLAPILWAEEYDHSLFNDWLALRDKLESIGDLKMLMEYDVVGNHAATMSERLKIMRALYLSKPTLLETLEMAARGEATPQTRAIQARVDGVRATINRISTENRDAAEAIRAKYRR